MVVEYLDNINEKLVEARLRDVFTIARKNREKKASNFLDPREQQIAKILRVVPRSRFYFDGGHKEAERQVMIAFPEELRDEPSSRLLGLCGLHQKILIYTQDTGTILAQF